MYYARRPGGTAGRCIIVLRDVVDSYLFRMHTFHVTSHCIIGPTGSSMNKHTFAEALAQTVNVIVYAEFEAVLEIDKGRNIIYNHP